MLIPSIHERKTWLIFLLVLVVGGNFYFNFSFKQSLEERAISIDRVCGKILLPLQSLVATGKITVSDSALNLKELSQAKEINVDLLKRLHEQERHLKTLGELKLENERLRSIVSFREKFTYEVIAARIIGTDPSALFKTLIVNRGSEDGIQEGMAVISTTGVVGKIFQVESARSRVLLISDINSRVDAVVQRSRTRAIVAGSLGGEIFLRHLPRRQDLQVGDVLVSSGMDEVFPSGVEIGKILSVRKDPNLVLEEAVLEPSVDFGALEEVLIVKKRGEP